MDTPMSANQTRASRTLCCTISAMFRPATKTDSTSGFRRCPLHFSQGVIRMDCSISSRMSSLLVSR